MAYVPLNRNGMATMADSSPVTIAYDQAFIDTFGKLKLTNTINYVDVSFFRDKPQNLVNIVTATTGATATSTGGYAQFSTPGSGSGQIRAYSYGKVKYSSNSALIATIGAAFLDGGYASTFQRIGPYDSTIANGIWVGYEDLQFGCSIGINGGWTQTIEKMSNLRKSLSRRFYTP